jgi:hypothetical protein
MILAGQQFQELTPDSANFKVLDFVVSMLGGILAPLM